MILIELGLIVIIFMCLGMGIKTGNMLLKENRLNENTMTPEQTKKAISMHRFMQVGCVLLFAVTLISGYFEQKRTYDYLRSDILSRGLIEETGQTSEIKPEKYMMDDLILHVYSEDPDSEEYIEAANEQYEQWENLTFSQYLKSGVTDLFHIKLRKARTDAIESMDVTNPTYWKLNSGNSLVEEDNSIHTMSVLPLTLLALWTLFSAEYCPPGRKWWT